MELEFGAILMIPVKRKYIIGDVVRISNWGNEKYRIIAYCDHRVGEPRYVLNTRGLFHNGGMKESDLIPCHIDILWHRHDLEGKYPEPISHKPTYSLKEKVMFRQKNLYAGKTGYVKEVKQDRNAIACLFTYVVRFRNRHFSLHEALSGFAFMTMFIFGGAGWGYLGYISQKFPFLAAAFILLGGCCGIISIGVATGMAMEAGKYTECEAHEHDLRKI